MYCNRSVYSFQNNTKNENMVLQLVFPGNSVNNNNNLDSTCSSLNEILGESFQFLNI